MMALSMLSSIVLCCCMVANCLFRAVQPTEPSGDHPSQQRGVALGPVPASGAAQGAVDDEADAQLSSCVVCRSYKRNTLFLPCKHLACCRSCADTVLDRRPQCPVCKQPITQVIHGVFSP
mmetsp:Transcript_57883/g.136406  ORF Transcript_57883/g.136406 Transcript_57883/m.136406 type:complete len:120 (+) Transcript_57883:228-587(+)